MIKEKEKMIKAITFDLDNTLIDFMLFKRKASSAAAVAMVDAGLKMSKIRARKELFKFYLKHGIESDAVFSMFLKKHRCNDDRVLAAGINAYLKTKYKWMRPYPGVKKTLIRLKKKYKLAIVTDAPRLKAYIRLDEMGIADYFDIVVGGKKRLKPAVFPFRRALKVLKVKPSEVMHVGDMRERDILGAQRVGMKSCIALYGTKDKKKGKIVADCYIEKFEDLINVLDKV